MDPALTEKYEKLKKFLKKRFQWDIPTRDDEEEEEGEDAPQIVDLES